MSIRDLRAKTFAGEISEGKHTAVILSAEYHEGSASHPDADYFIFSMSIDGGRAYKRNMFENDLVSFLSQSRRQLGRATEDIVPDDYIEELISNKTMLDIWFTYPVVKTMTGYRRVQNIAWLPQLEAPTPKPQTQEPAAAKPAMEGEMPEGF